MDRELDDLVGRNHVNRRGGAGGRRRGGGGGAGFVKRRLGGGGFGGGGGGGGGFLHDDRTAYSGHDDRTAGGGAFRRNRSAPRRNNPYSRSAGSVEGQWEHDKFEEDVDDEEMEDFEQSTGGGGNRRPRGIETGTRLQIDNLAYSVLADDLKDLFEEIGDLKRSTVHFDKSGRSLGKATVVFARRGDAIKAMKQYNNVSLDDQPMKISIVGTNVGNTGGGGGGGGGLRSGGLTISVGAPRARRILQSGGGGGGGGFGGFGRRGGGLRSRVSGGGGGGGGGGGRRGGRGGRRGGGGGGGRDKTPTAEELDAEMDAYNDEA